MSATETRRRTGRLLPIRCLPEEEAAVREKAADGAMSVGSFMLRAALGRQTRTHIDNHIVDELRRLGAQQKELFRQGGGVLQQEYATLLAEITRAIVRMAS
ncbi:plasmid mobilization protein MobA [Azohydromonas aeria]|uniref:plasmid mobilization protein MobA n=1 Tax=Azohydromonas aeria TaxID=2590212 RepID=UPI0012F9DDC0|nr:plasmid mobilization protein MobA [Azohydromonas aeria]